MCRRDNIITPKVNSISASTRINNFEAHACTMYIAFIHRLYFMLRKTRLSKLRERSCKSVDVTIAVVTIMVIVNQRWAYAVDSIEFIHSHSNLNVASYSG